ncbi:MAG: ArsR/SmtB family transcription factor [Methanosarcina sp.]
MNGLEDQDDFSESKELPQGPERIAQDNRVLVLPVNGDSRKLTQILSNETSLKILELLGNKSMSASKIAEELHLPLTTVKYNLDSLVESDLIKVKQIKWSQKGRQVKIYEPVEKLIVLVPSKNSLDKISILNLLQKYLGVIGAAFFAAAGIEYFWAYMQAKRIYDATAPLRKEIPQVNQSIPENAGANETEAIIPKMIPDQAAEENQVNISSVEPETLDTSTENASSGLDTETTPGVAESDMVDIPDSNISDGVQSIPPVPHEGLAHVGGLHSLYDTLALHPGIWFFFGCIFIVFLLIVREVYYKKKTK